jgi:hypothetical protein
MRLNSARLASPTPAVTRFKSACGTCRIPKFNRDTHGQLPLFRLYWGGGKFALETFAMLRLQEVPGGNF